MTAPTNEQITQLRANCYNISLWLDHTHDFLQDVLNEVYLKLSQDSGGDPGQSLITKINDITFAIISDVDFPGAGITGYAIQGLMSSYDSDTPDSLKKTFGNVWARFGATFQQAEDDFGKFASDPVKYWDYTYTNPVTGMPFVVSELANPNVFFPSRDPKSTGKFYNPDAFNVMTDQVKSSFKYNLTRNVMGQKWSILHQPNSNFWDGWNDDDARRFAVAQIAGNRDVFLTWWHDQEGSCAGCPNDGISTSEPRIGAGDWYSNWDYYHGEQATKDMCDWLMQDDGFGNVLNPDALTTRRDVFYNWPLSGNLTEHPDHVQRPWKKTQATSESRERAKRWHKLFSERTRSELEAQIVQRTVDDPKFRADLVRNPKAALEAHLGLPIPEEVKIEVVLERPGDYKLVLPYVGRPERKSK